MNVRLTIEKDGAVLVTSTYEIKTVQDWHVACAEIWRQARNARPLADPNTHQFLSGLDDLWGASMKLDKA